MKRLVIYLLAGAALLFPIDGNSAVTAPVTASPVKDPRDNFLPDWDFSGKVYQVTANPIIWSDDRSLAVIYDDHASGVPGYTFWCLKRNAQGKMAPIARYAIWADFPKKGILLDAEGLTVVLESTKWQQQLGTTKISHYFPFAIPQAEISFTKKGNEHLNGVKHEDLEKEWERFLGR